MLTCTDRRATRPADYVISCADANAQWKDVHWMSWGRHTASGRGDYYVNDCTPYCAAGKFHTYRAAIRLSAVRSTAKYGPLFSQATVSYTVDGRTKTQGYDLID